MDVEGVNLEQLEKWRRKVEDCLNPETLNIVVEGDKDDKVQGLREVC